MILAESAIYPFIKDYLKTCWIVLDKRICRRRDTDRVLCRSSFKSVRAEFLHGQHRGHEVYASSDTDN